jgi:hypothetical protein
MCFLSLVSGMFQSNHMFPPWHIIQECDIIGGDIKEVNQ